MEQILECFAELDDPRAGNARHELVEILFIALAATLCGATSCAEMALFGRVRESDLRELLTLPHGIPSHDTFSKVFRHLNPEAFEKVFVEFMAAFARHLPTEGVIAIDGKVLRRAYEKGKEYAPQMMVTAWGSATRMVLGCRGSPEGREVAAVLELLGHIDIRGGLVTTDALHCRRDTAQAIQERGADYVLALKGNQPKLKQAVEETLENRPLAPQAKTKEYRHGRLEQRAARVKPALDIAEKHDFPGLVAVGSITSKRTLEGRTETATRYYLLSRLLTPEQLLQTVRAHWDIENGQHWALDVVLDEDLARTRKDHGARNLAIIRRLTLNLLRAHPDKGSLRGKIKRAGWDNNFLLSLLSHMR